AFPRHGHRMRMRGLGAVRRAGLAMSVVATVAAVTLLGSAGALPGSSPVAGAAVPNATVAFKSNLPAGPAFNGDAGDPDVVESAGTFYAFTTGTPLGNHLQ